MSDIPAEIYNKLEELPVVAFDESEEFQRVITSPLFDDIFKDCTIKLDFKDGDLKGLGYTASKSSKKLGIKVFDCCEFSYNKTKKELTISEFITDESKCSYEGLMSIIEQYFPERLGEYRRLINHYYLVLPSIMRPFTIGRSNGTKYLGSHKLSTWYSMLIRLCCAEATESNSNLNYKDCIERFKTPGEKVRYTALLRAFINIGKKEATKLLNTSKENLARGLYAVRTKSSARCAIVPSTELAIDELGVPRSIAYEMLREDFIEHLQKELNFTYKEAKKATKLEALNPETQKLFQEYAEKRLVIVNRAPSLHEYSSFAVKLKLNDLYAIQFPIALCEPLNAKQYWCFKIPLNAGNSR